MSPGTTSPEPASHTCARGSLWGRNRTNGAQSKGSRPSATTCLPPGLGQAVNLLAQSPHLCRGDIKNNHLYDPRGVVRMTQARRFATCWRSPRALPTTWPRPSFLTLQSGGFSFATSSSSSLPGPAGTLTLSRRVYQAMGSRLSLAPQGHQRALSDPAQAPPQSLRAPAADRKGPPPRRGPSPSPTHLTLTPAALTYTPTHAMLHTHAQTTPAHKHPSLGLEGRDLASG